MLTAALSEHQNNTILLVPTSHPRLSLYAELSHSPEPLYLQVIQTTSSKALANAPIFARLASKVALLAALLRPKYPRCEATTQEASSNSWSIKMSVIAKFLCKCRSLNQAMSEQRQVCAAALQERKRRRCCRSLREST